MVMMAATFAYHNSLVVTLYLGFMVVEDAPISLAFIVTFAIGWVAGLLTVSLALLRVLSERRKLRRKLKLAEVELNNIRRLPL
ncbi:MAG: hypothetical protein CMM56_05440 [Rhodospirillaceae bacterium]|nr:hypothetical protein [Rhodospirillaceae bacterium]